MQLPLHTYPRQLAERIWSTWINENRMHAAIDAVETLDAFFSVAYQASLLREETRQVECRIALLGLEHVDGLSMSRIGFRLFRFAKPRIFAEQEIRRVAPATGFYRSMIAVQRSRNR